VIAKGVMAIAEVSPGPHHAIGAFFKGTKNVRRTDPPGTHHPDEPYIGRILHPAHPGSIRPSIRAPVTGEHHNSRIEIIRLFLHNVISLETKYMTISSKTAF